MSLIATLRLLKVRCWAAASVLSGRYDAAPRGWALPELDGHREFLNKLATGLTLTRDIETVAFDVLSRVDALIQHESVFESHCTLLVRTLHDVRAAVLTMLRGYTLQSWAITASAFEAAHAMGWVGRDAVRAQKWLSHNDSDRLPFSVRQAVRSTFDYLDLGDARERPTLCENEYKHYSSLCIAKHVNPVAERGRYWISNEGTTRLMLTPFIVDTRVTQAQLGIALACRSALLAVWIFDKTNTRNRDARLQGLGTRCSDLLARWRQI